MILGHAFAFMVINYGKKTEDEKDSFDKTKESPQTHSFDSPWKIFVMTITMALGEFQVILVASGPHQGKYIRKEQLSQALNCSCISELNTGAFTINLIVNAPVFSSDIQLQFRA